MFFIRQTLMYDGSLGASTMYTNTPLPINLEKNVCCTLLIEFVNGTASR